VIKEHLPYNAHSPPNVIFESPERRTVASYERELTRHRSTEARLRDALAREEALLRQKDELIQQKELMSKESDHRLLNGLQMIVSLLSLQSRATANAEVASQLAAAADRCLFSKLHPSGNLVVGALLASLASCQDGPSNGSLWCERGFAVAATSCWNTLSCAISSPCWSELALVVHIFIRASDCSGSSYRGGGRIGSAA